MMISSISPFTVTPDLLRRGVAEIIADDELDPTNQRDACEALGISHHTLARWLKGDRGFQPLFDLTIGGALDAITCVGHTATDQEGRATLEACLEWREAMYEKYDLSTHTHLARVLQVRRETINNYMTKKEGVRKYVGIAMNAALQGVRPYSVRAFTAEGDYTPPWRIKQRESLPGDMKNFMERYIKSGAVNTKAEIADLFTVAAPQLSRIVSTPSPIRWGLAFSALANDLDPVAKHWEGDRLVVHAVDFVEWEKRMYIKNPGLSYQELMAKLGISEHVLKGLKREGAPIVYGYAMAALEAGLREYRFGDDLRLRCLA